MTFFLQVKFVSHELTQQAAKWNFIATIIKLT